MARGVFSGLIWGVVVAGAGAGGLSLAYPDFKPGTKDAMMSAPQDSTQPQTVAVVDETPVAAPEQVEGQSSEQEMSSDVTVDAVDPEEMAEPADENMAVAVEDVVETAEQIDAEVTTVPESTETEVVQPEVTEPETDEMAVEAEVPDAQTDPQTDPQTVSEADETMVAEETGPAVETMVTPPETPSDVVVATEQAPAQDPASSITDEIIAALPKTEGTVGNLAPQVKTDRLPSLGQEEEPAQEEASAVAPPPIERFAAPFTADEGKPLMAIVLIDEGDSELGVEALAAFPYPITFAVDASTPDATQRMETYRSKGFEVMALAGLPQGATASDAEVAMASYLSTVPEAVAVLEAPDVSLQGSREVTDQITKIMLESGHGLVLQANGLNTAQKLARREGIPSATVFRDFDGKGQNAGVIRRFLDQAAFKAGQEGGAIMLGRLRAETISALLIWGLADRASRVALVPVSAVLTKDDLTR